MLVKEMIYMVLDLAGKITSDDSYFTEDHIKWLLGKYRAMLLKRELERTNKELNESNYQVLCLDLEEVPAIDGGACEGGPYLRSKEPLPVMINKNKAFVYPTDYYTRIVEIQFVPKERMRYVGNNKWLSNFIYASVSPDNYLYLYSANPQFLYLEKVKMYSVFEDYEAGESYSCEEKEGQCDDMEKEFPIEEALVPELIDAVVKTILGANYRPEPITNNAIDDAGQLQQQAKVK